MEAYPVDTSKFPHLAKLSNEKELKNLFQMHKRLTEDTKLLKELHNKHLVLIMGRTGSGKSTFANALISGSKSLVKKKKRETGPKIKATPLIHNNRQVF